MFHILGTDGINRALIPGEFRFRGQVQAVGRVQPMTPVPAVSASEEHSAPSHQSRLIGRYQSPTPPEEPNEVLFVRDIMTTNVASLPPTATIAQVARLFGEQRYRHIPIVSSDRSLVGLISDRDVLRHQATSSHRELQREPVSTIMVSEVLVATQDTLIRDAARTMIEERIGSLPIITEGNALAGIVTRSDILRALITHGPMRIWA